MKWIIFLMLTGCAGISSVVETKDAIGVAAGTVAVAQTVKKVKEVFTPKFLLQVNPLEICDITQDPVVCYITPCATDCESSTPFDKWIEENPKVLTLESSAIVESTVFCDKNPKACEIYRGSFNSNLKVVITKEEVE